MAQHPLDEDQKPQVTSSVFTQLQRDWLNVLRIILAPVPVFLVIFAMGLVVIQSMIIHQAPTSSWSAAVNVLTTIVISLTTAIAGAVLHDRWRHLNEKGVLFNKGRSAVRGLNLLLSFSVGLFESIERDAQSNELLQDRVDTSWMRHVLERLSRESGALSMHIIAAIEEWEDIIPEVQNQSSRVNQWEAMREKLAEEKRVKETLEFQIHNAEKELQATSEDREKERSDVEATLQQLRSELDNKNRMIRQLERKINDSILITRSPSSGLSFENLVRQQPGLPPAFDTYVGVRSAGDSLSLNNRTESPLRLAKLSDDK